MSVSACKKSLLFVCLVGFSAPASGMWLFSKLNPLNFFSSKPETDLDKSFMEDLKLGEQKPVIENPEIVWERLLKVFGIDDTTVLAHENVCWMVQPKKSAHAFIGNTVCAPVINQQVLDEAQKFFGKKLYAIVVDAAQKESEDFLKEGYKKSSLVLMSSDLNKLSLKQSDSDDFMVIDVRCEALLKQWCAVYLGNGATEKEVKKFAGTCADVLCNAHVALFLGSYKEENKFEPRIAGLFVVDSDTVHLVRLSNLITDEDKKDARGLEMIEKSLSMMTQSMSQKNSDLKKFVAMSSPKQELAFATLGLVKTQQLARYVKNQ